MSNTKGDMIIRIQCLYHIDKFVAAEDMGALQWLELTVIQIGPISIMRRHRRVGACGEISKRTSKNDHPKRTAIPTS